VFISKLSEEPAGTCPEVEVNPPNHKNSKGVAIPEVGERSIF